MPRFFVSDPPEGDIINIYGDDARHIGRSLRMRLGDEITVCRLKKDYICNILTISDDCVTVHINEERKSKEPSINLTLYMAVPKLDKLELIVQKATELGAAKIVPVLTKRCVSRPDPKQFSKKRERLERIALEAAKQSERGIVPEVSDIIDFDACVNEMKNYDVSLVCYEKGGVSLSSIKYPKNSDICVFIGSEGGFEQEEINRLSDSGVKTIWLGDRILRCETAPISAISIIMHLTGNM